MNCTNSLPWPLASSGVWFTESGNGMARQGHRSAGVPARKLSGAAPGPSPGSGSCPLASPLGQGGCQPGSGAAGSLTDCHRTFTKFSSDYSVWRCSLLLTWTLTDTYNCVHNHMDPTIDLSCWSQGSESATSNLLLLTCSGGGRRPLQPTNHQPPPRSPPVPSGHKRRRHSALLCSC